MLILGCGHVPPRRARRQPRPRAAKHTGAPLHASPTCRWNGPASTTCSAFQLNNPRIRTVSLRTKVSVAGKRNFQGRDKEAETAWKVQGPRCRDKASLNNPANSGLVSENQEISVSGRMRGGAERTRTPCQARSSIEPVSVNASMLQARAQK
jgi:hypothetical protein